MDGEIQSWLQRIDVSWESVIATTAVLFAAWLIVLLINSLLRRGIWRAARRLNVPFEASLTGTRVLTAGVWVLAILLLLNLWGVNVTGLWTLLISAAAVIGVGFLAVWTMVSNVTASLFLTIWRPFHLGETIELLPENLKGRVIDRNMMFTAVRDEGGNLLQIPNNLFFQKMFRVVGDSGTRSLFELLETRGNDMAAARRGNAIAEQGSLARSPLRPTQ